MFRRALLGSVTAKVLHDATVPVWTDAHCTEPTHRAHPQPRLIVVAIDLKEDTGRTLQTALSLARDAGAAVEILHIEPEGHVTTAIPEVEVEKAVAIAAAAGALELEHRHAEDLEVSTEGESVAAVVRRVSLLKRADLVVIGRGRVHGHLLDRLHSHAYSVVCHAPCPVLSV
jgi:nucleotide-binding universal stress UspA family protein